MVLIPKVPNAFSTEQYCPIMLGNFIFKIITIILANMMEAMATRIISLNHFSFVKGRQIKDYIVLTSDLIA